MSRFKMFWVIVIITSGVFSVHVSTLVAGSTHLECVGRPLKVALNEGLTAGRILFKFKQDENIMYAFHQDDFSQEALSIFQITPAGTVTNVVTLDHEDHRGNEFILTVLAKNNIGQTSSEKSWVNACSLTVTILDLNDHSPLFNKDLYVGYIQENQPKGTTVRGLNGVYATDLDTGANSVHSYEVISGNGQNKFEAFVEELNGKRFLSIRSKVELDREKASFYVLTVQATDRGTPPRTGRTQIRINVEDKNDCSPKFTSSEYLVSVLSTVPVSTEILKVHAQDGDSEENSEIYYFFKKFQTKTKHDNYFTVDPHGGVVRVARDLGSTSDHLIRMTIVAQDRGNPPRRTETTLEVELLKEATQSLDISTPRLPPKLAKPTYLVRIREDLPINSHVLFPDVLHLSKSKFKNNFEIVSEDDDIPFRVDVNSGLLYLVENLDFETKRRYELKLVLTSLEKSEANVTVLVDDADENYNAPVFKKENIATVFSARKDMKSSHFVTKVKAFDPDERLEGKLNYRINDGDGVGKFSIDHETGRILSVFGLNWEGVHELGLLIEARDSARRWKRGKQFLLVTVIDQQDCNPMFAKVMYEENVRENLPRGVFVAVVKARLCHDQRVEYFITEGNSRNSFEIDKYSGIVSTRSVLDREEQAVYTLEITARNRSRSSKALLVINIDDVNDHNPVFLRKNYQVEITENRGKITSLLCLVAKDEDYGNNERVEYSIVSGNDENLFHIDGTSGTLSSEPLNFEIKRVHGLRIKATDHGVPPRSSFTTVKVLVKNVNDPPKFQSNEITVNVDEEKPAGTRMVFLPVADEDVGKNGEFDCSYENTQPSEFGKFQVVTTAGGCEVQNKILLKWFEGSLYSLRVIVTDKAPPLVRKSDVITVTIKVNDLNNHDPMFLQDSYHSFVSPRASSILTVTATDEDSGRNARIKYSLASKSTLFRINSRTGKLTAFNGRLPVRKYVLDVYAEDQGSPKRRTKVNCVIIVGSQPLRITLTESKPKLYENVALNTLVSNADVNKAGVQYLIVGGNIGNAFNISQHGRISVASTLDYERVTEYRLAIRVVDESGEGLEQVAEKVLKITILDINDHEPRFTILQNPLVLNINTKIHPGSVITRILTYDADSVGTVTYTIKSDSSQVPFDINTMSGEITARHSVQSRSLFTVVAEDGGTPRKRSELEVDIRILRDHSSLKIPGHQLIAKINEGRSGVGLDIVNLGINNKAEHELTYSIVNGNHGNVFCLDVRGSLQAVRELDRESRANYVLSVSVDDGESSEISDVHVTVNDLDDHRPKFPNDVITIFTDENAQAQKIATLSAKDKDIGNVTYGIIGTSRESFSSVFVMDDGILMITRTLDHEEAGRHVLTIVAEDQASHKAFTRALVLVRDKNDNAPRFLSREYAEYVHLNAPKGYRILRTRATDKDSGLSGSISYTIHPSSNMFAIDESTGWLRVASKLTHGNFIFNVTAKDHGTPRRSDTVSVMVTVDVSAGSPRFSYVGYPRGFHVSVKESHRTGSKVLKLTAVSNDVVRYDLYRSNVSDFTIDPISGVITTTKPLDYENIKYYEFTVSATDCHERISLAHVNISVVNVNDNKPRILNKNQNNEISCRVRQDVSIGSSVINIYAQDLDNDRLHFSLTQNSKPALFSIDTTGRIKTVGSLRDNKDNIYLAVTVRDNGSPALEDTVTVNVVVVNYGDRIISTVAQVSEDTEVGKTIHVSPPIPPRYTSVLYTLIYPIESPFTIHSTLGDLSLKTRLDYEERQSYSLTVRLRDNLNQNDFFDVKITIEVTDENDNSPVFITPGDINSCEDPVGFKIHENAKKASLVYHFKANDKDSGLNGELYFEMKKCPGCTDVFSLNGTTGELMTTGASLTKPQYDVTVVVKDRGIPSKSTRACIIVQAGYWEPKFTKQEYHFELDESARVGQRIGIVQAHGFGVAVTYELRKPSMFFIVNPTSGILSLISTLDYEKSSERKIELNIITKQASSARVVVNVRDVNDCAPTFDQTTYTDSVPESAPVGSTLLKLHASDGDSGLNADIRYSLDSEQFIVDSYTGVVSTAVLLDFEKRQSYTIPVIAHDRGSPSLVGKTKLTINIGNVNDNWPVFTSQEYSCTILENTKPGSELTTVRATDADGDEISYDITGGNEAGLFMIGSHSGVLQLINDRSVVLVGPYYILNISATDGVFWEHSVVRVNIEDINDHAPVFTRCSDYKPSIPEISSPGTTVLQVSASDSDLGTNGHVTYAIVQRSSEAKFGIDRTTGRIETKMEFHQQQGQKFSILVKATDGNNEMKPEERLEGSCPIEVTITDVNDNKPVFERKSYTQKINENVEIGYSVLKVRASDSDEGLNAKITYSLRRASSLFSIHAETGVITTLAKLNNKKNRYILKIVATDHGEPSLFSEADVTINVIESNDEPQFQQGFYEITIPEDFKKEGIVAHVNASSRNPKLVVFYTLETGNTPATNSLGTFDIDSEGVVRAIKQLDRETVHEYTLTIRADTELLSASTTLKIFLTDVNDCRPRFLKKKYRGKVSENVAQGTAVLKVSAEDDDLDSETVYNMSGGNEYFSINSTTGLIQTKQMLDREEKDFHFFQVKASDKEKPHFSRRVLVSVEITDMNDQPPVFESKYYETKVKENEPNGKLIGQVKAKDSDVGINAKITYIIKRGNTDGNFRVDADDGRVLVNGNIDYEAKQTYELVIGARDGKHEDTTRMVIAIENENDNNPTFQTQLYEVYIEENKKKGSLVTTVKATDPDAKWIKYELSSLAMKFFRIKPNTNDIITNAVLDRERKDTYSFGIYAHDHDGKSGTAKVIVHVQDTNDNTPSFVTTSLKFSVPENLPRNSYVGTVLATDLDDVTSGNGRVSYGIVMDPNDAFTIDKGTGVVRTTAVLDREKKSTFRLTVNASDHGKPSRSSYGDVVITVLDANDHSPRFSQKVYEKTLPEDSKIGLVILQLTATDGDIGVNANLSFEISTHREQFKVNSLSGKVELAAQLDYEEKTEYNISVKVKDGGDPILSDKATVIIKLTDINDCHPVFSPPYNFKIREGETGSPGRVTAGDEDGTAENSEVRYSIPDEAVAKGFVVDPDTGELSVRTPLDYEEYEYKKHSVKVRATNVAPPFLYGEADVVIKVEDINDNAPKLDKSRDQNVLENSNVDGHVTSIGTLRATDADEKPNGGPFTFKILSGNEKELFQLNSKTGLLTTSSNFDREEKAIYELVVSIRDSGSPPLTNNDTVKIHVTDRNDNQHREGYLELTVNIFEQQTMSPSIGRVFVNDSDTDDLRYYDVITGDTITFTVNRLTGDITMNERPAAKEYKFLVRVSDRNSTFHPVDCGIKITVNILSSKAFSRSITLRFLETSAAKFVANLKWYRREIAKALKVIPENVDIFSIQSVPSSDVVDVRLAAHGSPYYAPERLISILREKTISLKNFQNVIIGYDACIAEPCKSGGCRSHVTLTGTVRPVDSGHGQTLASAETSVVVKCKSCEKLFPRKISCEEKPCLNSGVCKDIPGGYLCTCPHQYQGPNCELTTRSFKSGEWVWLRALKSCSTGTLSLEFSTLGEDGLLLYAGPTTSYEGKGLDTSDFIAIQLHRGKIRVKLSLGDLSPSSLSVKTSKKLNDGKWHMVEIYRNATFVRVVVDQCSSSLMKTDMTEDRSHCEQTMVIRNKKFRSLDINTPVHLGGILKSPPEYLDLGNIVYDGCIRNVRENGIMFDLKDISNSKGSQEGCPAFDQHCLSPSPCARKASCVASRNDFSCVCPPGFGGKRCEAESLEQTFNESSFIIYRPHRSFLEIYNPKFTEIQMMIRTRDTDGGPLLMIRDKNGFRRLVLKLTNDTNRDLSLEGKVNLGGKEVVVRLTNTLLDDGKWHHVTISRYRNEVRLGIDQNNNPRTAKVQDSGSFIHLQLTPDSEIILGTSAESGNGFDGCIKDVRLNGKTLPYISESNNVALVKEYKDVKPGCYSGACDEQKCPANSSCYDKWRARECLIRRCIKSLCLNQAVCVDYIVNGVASYRCECKEGFNGSHCETGSGIIRLSSRMEVINVKLVVGLSCFVLALVLATLLIVCYHRHQTKGKAIFDRTMTLSKLDKNRNSSKKSLVVVDWSESSHEPNKTNNSVKNLPPSTHSIQAHIHNTTRPTLMPVKSHPLEAIQHKPLSRLPAWDIPPMIDIVLSPESDPSSTNDDYIEDPDEIWQDTQSRYVREKAALPENSPSEIEPADAKDPTVTWNDIEEYGRKFYQFTKNFLARDDGRPISGVSTTSNSSSVVTVVENPLA